MNATTARSACSAWLPNRNCSVSETCLAKQIKVNDQWLTVIGVLADANVEKQEFEGVKIQNPNNDIYIPITTALRKFEGETVENELNEIIIETSLQADLSEQASTANNLMSAMHRYVDDYSIVVPEKLLEQNQRTQGIFNIVMGAIASISLLVGGIGIMNIMLASVLERTNEIGLRRALGARKRQIRVQFMTEAVAISLVGRPDRHCARLRHFPAGRRLLGLEYDHHSGLDRSVLRCQFGGWHGLRDLPGRPGLQPRSDRVPQVRVGKTGRQGDKETGSGADLPALP